MDTAIAQLVSEAVVSEGVIDVYAAAGIDKPELSILSDEFLDGLVGAERPNLQFELLRRLLDDEIREKEDLAPLTDAQRAQIKPPAAPPAAP